MNLKQKKLENSRKIIESILHPYPVIDGVEILHTHIAQYIEFEAWRGDFPLFPPAKRRSIKMHRNKILYDKVSLSEDNIAWLIGSEI